MVTPGGVVSTFVAAGLNRPAGLAFDTSGNLYVANAGDNTVSKIAVVATLTPITATATVADAALSATATPISAVGGRSFSKCRWRPSPTPTRRRR